MILDANHSLKTKFQIKCLFNIVVAFTIFKILFKLFFVWKILNWCIFRFFFLCFWYVNFKNKYYFNVFFIKIILKRYCAPHYQIYTKNFIKYILASIMKKKKDATKYSTVVIWSNLKYILKRSCIIRLPCKSIN
jgi:hypothetical protein